VRGIDGAVGLGQPLFGLADGPALAFQLGAGLLRPLAAGPLLLGLALLGPGPFPLGPACPPRRGARRRGAGLRRPGFAGTAVLIVAELAEAEPAGPGRLDQPGGRHLGRHPRVGQGRAQGAGHLLLQRLRRVGDAGPVQGLPGQFAQQLAAGPGQFPQPGAVQCALGGAQVVAEPGEPVHRARVGPGQLVDHPRGAGGPAQHADGPGRRLVPGRAGLGHQVAAPVGELGGVGGVELVGGRPGPVVVGHAVIFPRPRRNMIALDHDRRP
jgi:hypothetical protein